MPKLWPLLTAGKCDLAVAHQLQRFIACPVHGPQQDAGLGTLSEGLAGSGWGQPIALTCDLQQGWAAILCTDDALRLRAALLWPSDRQLVPVRVVAIDGAQIHDVFVPYRYIDTNLPQSPWE